MIGDKILHLVGFSVGDEDFCVDILNVQEIIRLVEITRMPNAPGYVEGIVNLRGMVIPVIDFRKRCNLPCGMERNAQHQRIVVVAIGNRTIGLIVDRVSQVLKLAQDAISAAPGIVKGYDADFIRGIGTYDGRLLIILDLDKLLPQGELEKLGQAA